MTPSESTADTRISYGTPTVALKPAAGVIIFTSGTAPGATAKFWILESVELPRSSVAVTCKLRVPMSPAPVAIV